MCAVLVLDKGSGRGVKVSAQPHQVQVPGVEELSGCRGLTWHLADRFNCIVTQVQYTECVLWLRFLYGSYRCIVKLGKFLCTKENRTSVEMLCTCLISAYLVTQTSPFLDSVCRHLPPRPQLQRFGKLGKVLGDTPWVSLSGRRTLQEGILENAEMKP